MLSQITLRLLQRAKKVKAVDTTGAGDGFIGSFLYALKTLNVTAEGLCDLDNAQLERCIAFSNKFCGEKR